jgi:O-antigen/teichoic acid export membrane protein
VIGRYGGERIRRSFFHFMLGKAGSALTGFLAMVLVVRLLSIQDFATYSVLIALVEFVTALSGFGIAHALLRYVPDLYAHHLQGALRRFVTWALLSRTAILLAVVAIVLAWSDAASNFAGIGGASDPLRLFLVVIVFRTTNHFLSTILESTLHQGWVQSAYLTSSVVRLVGMAWLVFTGDASLNSVIVVEAIADGIAMCMFLAGLASVIRKTVDAPEMHERDARWLPGNIRAIVRFAGNAYLQHLAILPYGGSSNRVAGGHLLQPGALAEFGFSQSLYEYAKRYLPAQLLVGLIRPIMVSRYSASGDFGAASRLAMHVFNINVLSIGAIVVPLVVGGTEVLLFLSGGKYGNEALWLLLALALVLILETQRQQIELLAQTVEHYEVLFVGNLILSASIIPGIILVQQIGAIGFPLANLLGLCIANLLVLQALRRIGYTHSRPLGELGRTLLIASIAAVTGLLVKHAGAHWLLAGGIALILHVVLSLHYQWSMILNFLDDFFGDVPEHPSLPLVDSTVVVAKAASPVIAFGVLSCRKESSETIRELAGLVAPHPVIVHHDFSKCPELALAAPNIEILADHATTAWGDWSLVDATFRLMASAFSRPEVTHFQLLSEACLPVRSIREFERMLSDLRPAVMIEGVAADNREIFASHGWRYVSPNPIVMKIAKKLCFLYLGKEKQHRQVANMNISHLRVTSSFALLRKVVLGYAVDLLQKIAKHRLQRLGVGTLVVGSQWFAVDRSVGMWLIRCQKECPGLVEHFKHTHIPDEAFFPTLVFNCPGLDKSRLLASNHVLMWRGNLNGPDLLAETDLKFIQQSGRYFARKFPLDTMSPVRRMAIALSGERN